MRTTNEDYLMGKSNGGHFFCIIVTTKPFFFPLCLQIPMMKLLNTVKKTLLAERKDPKTESLFTIFCGAIVYLLVSII